MEENGLKNNLFIWKFQMKGSYSKVNKIQWVKVRLLWTTFLHEADVYGLLNVSPYKQDEFCHTLDLYKIGFYWLC